MKKPVVYESGAQNLEAMLLEEPEAVYYPQNFDLIRLSRQGVLKKYLLELAEKFSFTMQELSRILHLSERTLQRYRKEDTLSSEASERALLLAQLYQKGIAVFGSKDHFKDWLRTPLPAFQQQPPVGFLDTAFGFELVSDELGRIAHGVFA